MGIRIFSLYKTIALIFALSISSVNRIGSLRSQTQYSDISSEKRSPRTTVRLSIKQSNGATKQANNLQITVNGLGRTKSYGPNGNARSRSLNQSNCDNKAGSNLKVERTKSAQPDEANGINKKRNENRDNSQATADAVIRDSGEDRIKLDASDRQASDHQGEENGKRLPAEIENNKDPPDRLECDAQPNESLNGTTPRPTQSRAEEFPKLKKLIGREMKKLSEKQFSSKLIRCKTAVEIDDYMSSSKGRSKTARKLIFSETIG